MASHKQVRAIDALVDLFVGFILHVEGVIRLDEVDDDFLGKLDSETVFIDFDLFNLITTADLYSGFRHQVLYDHIGHQLAVGVSFLVQTVHSVEF